MRCVLPLLLVIAATPAAADVVVERALVIGRVDGGPWTDAPTEARLDQKAELAAIAIGKRGKRRVVLVPEGVETLRLGNRKVPARELEPLDAASITWLIPARACGPHHLGARGRGQPAFAAGPGRSGQRS
jgi:hypothetical protein